MEVSVWDMCAARGGLRCLCVVDVMWSLCRRDSSIGMWPVAYGLRPAVLTRLGWLQMVENPWSCGHGGASWKQGVWFALSWQISRLTPETSAAVKTFGRNSAFRQVSNWPIGRGRRCSVARRARHAHSPNFIRHGDDVTLSDSPSTQFLTSLLKLLVYRSGRAVTLPVVIVRQRGLLASCDSVLSSATVLAFAPPTVLNQMSRCHLAITNCEPHNDMPVLWRKYRDVIPLQ